MTGRGAVRLAGTLLAVLIGSGLAWGDNEVGDTATDFTLPDGAGVDHSLYDSMGDVILITFWDPW
jgi:hypothetical protein